MQSVTILKLSLCVNQHITNKDRLCEQSELQPYRIVGQARAMGGDY